MAVATPEEIVLEVRRRARPPAKKKKRLDDARVVVSDPYCGVQSQALYVFSPLEDCMALQNAREGCLDPSVPLTNRLAASRAASDEISDLFMEIKYGGSV